VVGWRWCVYDSRVDLAGVGGCVHLTGQKSAAGYVFVMVLVGLDIMNFLIIR